MRDLRQYWHEVREIERGLPEFVWIMSVEDPKKCVVGGRMAQASAANAAQRLHAKSHRRATDEEIAAHLEKENAARRESYQSELRKRGIAVVALPIATTPAAISTTPEKAGKPVRAKRR